MALWNCPNCGKENFASIELCQCGFRRSSGSGSGTSSAQRPSSRGGITDPTFVARNLEVIAWLLPLAGLYFAYRVWYDATHLPEFGDSGPLVYEPDFLMHGVVKGVITLLIFWVATVFVGAFSAIVRGSNNV